MSVQQLPSGRWRAQVYDPKSKKNVSVSKILGGVGTFPTKKGAKRARERARDQLDILSQSPGNRCKLLEPMDDRPAVRAAKGLHEHP